MGKDGIYECCWQTTFMSGENRKKISNSLQLLILEKETELICGAGS